MVSKKFEDDASCVLDSSASFHATPHRGYFIDYVQGDFGLVYLGDNEPCQIIGKGSCRMGIIGYYMK